MPCLLVHHDLMIQCFRAHTVTWHTIVCHMALSYDHKHFTCRAMETRISAGVCDSYRFILHGTFICKNLDSLQFIKTKSSTQHKKIQIKTDSQQAQVCQLKQFTGSHQEMCTTVWPKHTQTFSTNISLRHERRCLSHLFIL